MPKRRERVAPQPSSHGWDFRYANNDAAKGWELVCAAAPAAARQAWERIKTDPRRRDARQHPLKGSLGLRTVNAVEMQQWQYEITAGGRVWYCIDDDMRSVWLTAARLRHPKLTE